MRGGRTKMHKLAVALTAWALASQALPDEAKPGAAARPTDIASPSDRLATFFGRTKGITRLVPASEVWASIHAGAKRYFVVDVRPAEDYAKGHVPGAISLPIDVLFRPASLARLPASGQAILLVCQSGHTETSVKAGSPLQDGDAVHGVGGPIEK